MTCTRQAVFFVATLAACGSSANYGPPSDATMIDLQWIDGFAGHSQDREVRIVGTAVTYGAGAVTAQATLRTADVAAIIHALEDVDFLDLHGDYGVCSSPATDLPGVTITVALAAGNNSVSHYLGCMGGVFDDLKALDQKIFDLSGYTAWAAGR